MRCQGTFIAQVGERRMSSKENRCGMKHCRKDQYILYYGAPVCEDHWDNTSRLELRSKLGVEEVYKAMETGIDEVARNLQEYKDSLDE